MLPMTIDIHLLRDLLSGQQFGNPLGQEAVLDAVYERLRSGGVVLGTEQNAPTHLVIPKDGVLQLAALPGYMPYPVKYAPDGSPLYIYVTESGALRWVVSRNGHASFSDENGRELTQETTPAKAAMGGAVLGGLLGLAFGGAGVLVGAAIGAALGGAGEKARRG
jgi:hypothetical protein